MFRNNNPISGIDQLTHKLKQADQKYSRLSKGMQIIYWVLVLVYLIMVIHHAILGGSPAFTISGVFILAAMLIFSLLFRHFYKEYKHVDYSLPTLVMLKKAVYRYQPFQNKTLWALLAVVFINIGLSLGSSNIDDFIGLQITFRIFMGLAIGVGLLHWYYRYKPLRDAALRMIKEIEEQ